MEITHDSVIGIIAGGMFGNSLGNLVKGLLPYDIARMYPHGLYAFPKGASNVHYSGDVQLTLSVLDAIAHDDIHSIHHVCNHIRANLDKTRSTRTFEEEDDIILEHLQNGGDPFRSAETCIPYGNQSCTALLVQHC